MTRPGLGLTLVTASIPLPADLTDTLLLEAETELRCAMAGQVCQLAPERVGDELTLTVLAVSPTQARALATYVQELAGTPRRFLNPEARVFLDAFFGS